MFKTKKYTRPLLLKELRKLNETKFTNLKTLANTISPRAGLRSAKVAALRQFTNRKIATIFNDGFTGFGAKQIILSYLKN